MNPNLLTDQTPRAASGITASETQRAENETPTLVKAAAATKTSCELFEGGAGI
ncbi:MAG TPA: hypothetical protein VKE70_29655 [Candidatus Solibacter sp.]|nr:hypothetical protein [Candidatus Solibacter sp.]